MSRRSADPHPVVPQEEAPQRAARIVATESVYNAVSPKSIPTYIRQLSLHISNNNEKVDRFVREMTCTKTLNKDFLWDEIDAAQAHPHPAGGAAGGSAASCGAHCCHACTSAALAHVPVGPDCLTHSLAHSLTHSITGALTHWWTA